MAAVAAEAALAELASHGLAGARLDKIASRAGADRHMLGGFKWSSQHSG